MNKILLRSYVREILNERSALERSRKIDELINWFNQFDRLEQLELVSYLRNQQMEIKLELGDHLDLIDDIIDRLNNNTNG